MKIDKKNPLHWLLLLLFAINVAVAIMLRPLLRKRNKPPANILFYGHKLSGNLLPIYRFIRREEFKRFHAIFLTMDPGYHRQLQAEGINACLAVSPGCILQLIRADAIVSDHGLHVMEPLTQLSSIKFFDVWHGIPFKGFDGDDFRVQHRYEETWVASLLLAEIYVNRFGFRPDQVVATGYARTDVLISPTKTRREILDELHLGDIGDDRLVLFAPTWAQDKDDRQIFPFGIDADHFLTALIDLCRQHGARLLFRSHLNTVNSFPPPENLIPIPFVEYPDTEAILQISDLLICDWSSIAFDYLLLDHPTLFLDVEPPFRKGFSLDPEYRFGSVITSFTDLLHELAQCLNRPDEYWAVHEGRYIAVREKIYGEYADGRATPRCINRLIQSLEI